jgi:ribonucleoside-diphosphate reductase alpha subunit
MRCAIGIELPNDDFTIVLDEETWEKIEQAYNRMSTHVYTHATPTLFNAGTPFNTLISCYLYSIDDSTESIMNGCKYAAFLSKGAGGLGFSLSRIRPRGSPIYGTGGTSDGVLNFLRCLQEIMSAFNQGGGKRKGVMTVTLEIWCADIVEFLNARLPQTDEKMSARGLFYALMLNDIFMERVRDDEEWSLMNPQDSPGLVDTWGQEHRELYLMYEQRGHYIRKVRAQELFKLICERIITNGMPFIIHKDAINGQSNCQGWGTITNSNLCSEIAEPSGQILLRAPPSQEMLESMSKRIKPKNITKMNEMVKSDEISNCNLASISLPRFVIDNNNGKTIDYIGLAKVASELTDRLDKVIDKHTYAIDLSKKSNMLHRYIAIGVQGLHETFQELNITWESKDAKEVNKIIFESIWYGAMSESTKIAKIKGVHPSYYRTPAALGFLQPDLYNIQQEVMKGKLPNLPFHVLYEKHRDIIESLKYKNESKLFDYDTLRNHIKEFGLRNAEVTALMPTASTSQIFGNTECFEPAVSNIFKRATMSGDHLVINKKLINEFIKQGLWCDKLANYLITTEGSIQGIKNIPDKMRELYKTVWEIPQKTLLELAAERSPFITQTQSMNVYLQAPSTDMIASMLMYGWKLRLKTGMYYLRSREKQTPQRFTITDEMLNESNNFLSNISIIDTTNNNNNNNNDEKKIEPIWTLPTSDTETCLLCSS